MSAGDRDEVDGLGTYQVKYSEYYEPYVIMAAVGTPSELITHNLLIM